MMDCPIEPWIPVIWGIALTAAGITFGSVIGAKVNRDLTHPILDGPPCNFPNGIEAAWEGYWKSNTTEFSTALTSGGDVNLSPETMEAVAALHLPPGLNVLESNGLVSLVYQPIRDVPPAVASKVQADLFEDFDLKEIDKVQKTMHDIYGRYLEYCTKKQPGEANAEDPEMVAMVNEGTAAAKEAWEAMPEPVKDHLLGKERKLTVTKWDGAV